MYEVQIFDRFYATLSIIMSTSQRFSVFLPNPYIFIIVIVVVVPV